MKRLWQEMEGGVGRVDRAKDLCMLQGKEVKAFQNIACKEKHLTSIYKNKKYNTSMLI